MKYEFYNNILDKEIAKKNKVSSLVAKAIEAYNLKLDKDLLIKDPYEYKGMQDVVGYLLKAIAEHKKIMVYGDYDVDGICSVAILKRMFLLMKTEIGYYIPNRYKDGYGLNEDKVKEIAKKGYEIIICIDNGINANSSIDLARSLGMEVLVLDHHTLNGELPNCNYFLHPNLSEFVSYNMCASTIAYYLSIALLSEDDSKCAILAGIATISDVMPLIEQNKVIVRNAIKLLNTHIYKNLDFLMDDNEYNENNLSMILIPKLNSVGRVIKDNRVNYLINFLFEDDENQILKYSKFIIECNELRKNISNEFYNKITTNNEDIIIVKDDNLLEGVCGVIASKLATSYNKVALVLAKSEDGNFYKGSGRANNGINLINMLSKLDYLVNFGGHKQAAGLTIKIEDFDRLKNDLNQLIKQEVIQEDIRKVILLNENELTYDNYLELLKYGPFGEGNPFPLFGLKTIDKSKVGFSKDHKHLIIKISSEVSLLGFNLANKYQEKYNNYVAIFTLDKNNIFKNKLSCKCLEVGEDHYE